MQPFLPGSAKVILAFAFRTVLGKGWIPSDLLFQGQHDYIFYTVILVIRNEVVSDLAVGLDELEKGVFLERNSLFLIVKYLMSR